jgi:TolB protein
MNKYLRTNLFLVLAFFIGFTKNAAATLDLELTQGIDSALPIVILPFGAHEPTSSNAASNIREVIYKDLQNSGRFHLIPATGINLKGEAQENLDYDYWRSQKANNVITGSVLEAANNHYKVIIELHDVYGRTILLDQQFTVSSSQLRSLAHHISDLIYEKLLGIPGIFSTRICYILVQRNPGSPIRYKLEIADADGFNPRSLITSNQPIMSPAWSPDGKYIAYVSFEGNRATIYKQEIRTGKREFITRFPGINGAPAWSPDGKKMAVVLTQTDDPKIYILDLTSNKLTQLTTGWSLDTEPAWAPDGQSLIFTSNRSGGPQIYKINLADKQIQRLTYEGNYNARASFSRDGKNLVMLHQDGDAFTIAVQNLDSGRLLTLTRSEFDESPSLAPNGNMVVYATNYQGRGVLAEVSLDGRVKLRLPERDGEVQEPAWSP